jgi:hypothetical protein
MSDITIRRIHDLGPKEAIYLEEGVFIGVVEVSSGEHFGYVVSGAMDGNQALFALDKFARKDPSLGVLFDGSSPVLKVSLCF